MNINEKGMYVDADAQEKKWDIKKTQKNEATINPSSICQTTRNREYRLKVNLMTSMRFISNRVCPGRECPFRIRHAILSIRIWIRKKNDARVLVRLIHGKKKLETPKRWERKWDEDEIDSRALAFGIVNSSLAELFKLLASSAGHSGHSIDDAFWLGWVG